MATLAASVVAMTETPDPRPHLDTTIELLDGIIAAVEPDRLGHSTPCTDWNVRDLLGHLVGVARRISAVGRDEPAMSVPLVVDGIPDADWAAAWAGAVESARDVWADDQLLGRIVHPPFGDMPGAVALDIYIMELSVHAWDLATAVGAQPEWDDAIIGAALAGARASLPAAGRGDDLPFDDAATTADDAPLIEQLVAYFGRRPRVDAA